MFVGTLAMVKDYRNHLKKKNTNKKCKISNVRG